MEIFGRSNQSCTDYKEQLAGFDNQKMRDEKHRSDRDDTYSTILYQKLVNSFINLYAETSASFLSVCRAFLHKFVLCFWLASSIIFFVSRVLFVQLFCTRNLHEFPSNLTQETSFWHQILKHMSPLLVVGEVYVYDVQVATAVITLMTVFLLTYSFHCTWVTSEAYSSPSIVLSARGGDGSRIIFDDFREAYYWLRYNTPEVGLQCICCIVVVCTFASHLQLWTECCNFLHLRI